MTGLGAGRRVFTIQMLGGKFLGTVFVQMKTPGLALPPIQAGVDGDAVKPGGKFRRAAKRADLLVGTDERLLREISASAGDPVIRNVSE